MLKSVPGDFEELYYREIFTIERFTIQRVDCIFAFLNGALGTLCAIIPFLKRLFNCYFVYFIVKPIELNIIFETKSIYLFY